MIEARLHLFENSLMFPAAFFALEVPSISNDSQVGNTHFCARELRHGREFVPVDSRVGDLVGNNEVMLRIDRCLHVITNYARTSRLHRTGIGIGQRQLFTYPPVSPFCDAHPGVLTISRQCQAFEDGKDD